MNVPISYWLPVDPSLALGAQPDKTGLEWLKQQGYSLIINLNTPSARNYWPEEAQTAMDLGMQYVHFPLDCSVLTVSKYAVLRGLLDANRQDRTFLHCAMNVKSSGMAHIWRVQELGHDPQQALQDLQQTPGHEPKWMEFWKTMGVA